MRLNTTNDICGIVGGVVRPFQGRLHRASLPWALPTAIQVHPNLVVMKTTSAEFIKSAFAEADWPREALPEIAFLGRSNVGKSSLINSLLNVHGLARTSSTPGRTQSLNFFLIDNRFRFVDLPGYGYARVPKHIRSSWGEMV